MTDTQRYTSRVFDAGIKIFEALKSAQIPQHGTTGKPVPVMLGDESPDKGAEKICIILDVEETQNEWVRLGAPGRDEPMVFRIVARSWVPNQKTTLDVWKRLEVLAGAIEDVMYDRPNRRVRALGFVGEVEVGRAAGVEPAVYPTPDGPMGDVIVTYRLMASI